MKVYFDNAATTRISKLSMQKMNDIMINNYGNPASAHNMGFEAEKEIINSKKILSGILGCKSSEIYFTSGGTESNNWVIEGIAKGYSRQGKHIISTKIEHPAILNPLKNLEENGFKVTYISVDNKGYINIDELKNCISSDTVLVSIMLTNNEAGTIQNIEEIGSIIKKKNQNTLFHTDAVQAFAKQKINVNKSKIDMLTASAHKFHGPRGIGILYIKEGIRIKPIILGGGQQNNMRSGTENTAGVAAMAVAAKENYDNLDQINLYIYKLKKALADGILQIPDTFINGDNLELSSPYILNVGFKNIRGQVLLNSLEQNKIFVSAGSACSSKNKHFSHVLTSMGIDKNIIEGSIRFSFSKYNTFEEVEFCIESLKKIVPILRKFNK